MAPAIDWTSDEDEYEKGHPEDPDANYEVGQSNKARSSHVLPSFFFELTFVLAHAVFARLDSRSQVLQKAW